MMVVFRKQLQRFKNFLNKLWPILFPRGYIIFENLNILTDFEDGFYIFSWIFAMVLIAFLSNKSCCFSGLWQIEPLCEVTWTHSSTCNGTEYFSKNVLYVQQTPSQSHSLQSKYRFIQICEVLWTLQLIFDSYPSMFFGSIFS